MTVLPLPWGGSLPFLSNGAKENVECLSPSSLSLPSCSPFFSPHCFLSVIHPPSHPLPTSLITSTPRRGLVPGSCGLPAADVVERSVVVCHVILQPKGTLTIRLWACCYRYQGEDKKKTWSQASRHFRKEEKSGQQLNFFNHKNVWYGAFTYRRTSVM